MVFSNKQVLSFSARSFEMGSFSLKPEERITKRADFVNLKEHGRKHYTNHFLVIIKKNRSGITRLGLTVSKRVGNSVKRNRIKRLIREFFRLNKQQIPRGYDVMIAALREYDTVTFLKVQDELGDLLFKNHDISS